MVKLILVLNLLIHGYPVTARVYVDGVADCASKAQKWIAQSENEGAKFKVMGFSCGPKTNIH